MIVADWHFLRAIMSWPVIMTKDVWLYGISLFNLDHLGQLLLLVHLWQRLANRKGSFLVYVMFPILLYYFICSGSSLHYIDEICIAANHSKS